MSVHVLQVHVHTYRLSAIYCNKVIALTTYYKGCASYL